jgi:hypothetical protein
MLGPLDPTPMVTPKEPQSFRERFKVIVETVAIIAVGSFFFYRFSTGWMSANMDVAIEPSRTHADAQNDYLAVVAKLERGEYGTLHLGHAQLRVTYLDSTIPPSVIDLVGVEPVSNVAGRLQWNSIVHGDPLNLHAKEKSQFAAALKVPRAAVCLIEATLLAHRKLDGPENYWGERRSSAVSLPLHEETIQQAQKPR